MGTFMRKKGYVPATILCSTAVRTKQTVELLLPALRADPKIRYEERLYLGEWQTLLGVVQSASRSDTPLLVVGHNPGLEQLAIALAVQPEDASERARREKLERKFPTAALAVLDFDEPQWSAVTPGKGRLTDFVRPRDLSASTAE